MVHVPVEINHSHPSHIPVKCTSNRNYLRRATLVLIRNDMQNASAASRA